MTRVTGRSASVTGIVLAGGQGRRMGGVDKGLVDLAGKPMVAHVLERFAPQVDEVLVNANQNLDRYAAFGYPVVARRSRRLRRSARRPARRADARDRRLRRDRALRFAVPAA